MGAGFDNQTNWPGGLMDLEQKEEPNYQERQRQFMEAAQKQDLSLRSVLGLAKLLVVALKDLECPNLSMELEAVLDLYYASTAEAVRVAGTMQGAPCGCQGCVERAAALALVPVVIQ